VQSNVNGWGVSNFSGRTIGVTVNGTGTPVTTIGAPLPAKSASAYYHFSSTAGQLPYASVYWW
jgi:xyloglucan-specific exo-beta-1,4-glucanase